MKHKDDFAVLILCHGRPDNTPTYQTFRNYGYTGKMYIICDDEDDTLPEYQRIFGSDNVIVFSKDKIADTFDTMDSTKKRGCAVYARNACFEIAKNLGLKYFCELDDDYTSVPYRYSIGDKLYRSKTADLDAVFDAYIEFLDTSEHIYSVAFGQPGDFIGGTRGTIYNRKYKRKAMNSWLCAVDKFFTFNGTMNDDVNTYLLEGSRGKVFLTFDFIMIDQPETQSVKGGMTELYLGTGTYQKSFYSVLCCPSFVKVEMMGDRHYRIHHSIEWNNAVPKIISDKYRR